MVERDSAPRSLRGDDRALSSVVGKTLELGLLALYVGLLVSTFYGGVVPEFRTTAGDAVADRTVAAVATDVETAIPTTGGSSVDDAGSAGRPGAGVQSVAVERELDVPRTIRGDPYRLRFDDGALVLAHPDPALSREVPLALPDAVVRVEGEARSGEAVVVVVESTPSGIVVRLEGR